MLPGIDHVLKNVRAKYDDDIVDRFNYLYSTSVMSIFVFIIGAKQYVGEPLQCWLHAEFKDFWESYIENYCFVENTYFVNPAVPLMPDFAKREGMELLYYQWVPIVLIFQMLIFLFPKAFWSAFNWKTGIRVRNLIEETKKRAGQMHDEYNGDYSSAMQYIHRGLHYNRLRARYSRFWGRYYICHVTVIYIIFKFLNIVNTVGQLIFMNHFLNTQYTFWGYGILKDILAGRSWRNSGHFPRVTMCDFYQRDDTSSRPFVHTVQCVLMINTFNEKIYIFLWFWMSFMSIINILNFIYWIVITFWGGYKRAFLRHHLQMVVNEYTEEEFEDFMEEIMVADGFTALRMLAASTNEIIMSEIVCSMFLSFRNMRRPLSFEMDENGKIIYSGKKVEYDDLLACIRRNRSHKGVPSNGKSKSQSPTGKPGKHCVTFADPLVENGNTPPTPAPAPAPTIDEKEQASQALPAPDVPITAAPEASTVEMPPTEEEGTADALPVKQPIE